MAKSVFKNLSIQEAALFFPNEDTVTLIHALIISWSDYVNFSQRRWENIACIKFSNLPVKLEELERTQLIKHFLWLKISLQGNLLIFLL